MTARYVIPHPDTGKPTEWTRATTFIEPIQDTNTLGQWLLRMTANALAHHPDLMAAVAHDTDRPTS